MTVARPPRWVRWAGLLAALGVAAGGCVSAAGRGVDWHEIAGDPAFDLRLDGAEAQEIEGTTGAGDAARGLDSEYSTASRRWVVAEGVAPEAVLAGAIAGLRGAGVNLRSLSCDSGRVDLLGDKTGTIDGRDALVDVFLTGAAAGAAEPGTVELRLSTTGRAGPSSPGDLDDPPGPRVQGDCPAAVVEAFDQAG